MSEDPQLPLDTWEPQAPPADFAERVLGRVLAEKKETKEQGTVSLAAHRRSRRRVIGASVVALGALAAAAALFVGRGPASRGAAIAKDRVEVSIGSRARAVLEPGAEVTWDGDDVVQAHGDVFYRVEPGRTFHVRTPAGLVEVKGTCFAVKVRGELTNEDAMNKRDMKSGVIGAGLSALAFVGVYEGKVAVSHASERMDVAAGESARLGPDGAHGTGSLSEGEQALAAAAASAEHEAPLAKANDNLVAQVSEYRARLEAIAAQKIELEQKLKKSEEKLASADGGPGRARPEYDLTPEDWSELAKKGEIKYRYPCTDPEGWSPPMDKLTSHGLAPQDAPVLRDAYERSYQRLWAQIRPLCATMLGAHAEVADKLGLDTCVSLIRDQAAKQDKEGAAEAQTEVAEIRAGLRAAPADTDKQSPVLRMYMALTGANSAFQSDLAKSFGPDQAYDLANTDDFCGSRHRSGGGKKRDASP